MFKRLIAIISVVLMFSICAIALDNLPTQKVVINDTPTLIVSENFRRQDLIIFNSGTVVIYIDNPITDCTTDSFPIPIEGNISSNSWQGSLYGIAPSGKTGELRVLETQY